MGDLLDSKYRIQQRLGGGGFGDVYLAEDELLKRQVAIKLLRDREPDRQVDLVHEMQSLDQLHHPAVVTFFHYFVDEYLLFLVMGVLCRRKRLWCKATAKPASGKITAATVITLTNALRRKKRRVR